MVFAHGVVRNTHDLPKAQRKGNRLPEPKAEGTCKRSLQAVRLTAGLGWPSMRKTIAQRWCLQKAML